MRKCSMGAWTTPVCVFCVLLASQHGVPGVQRLALHRTLYVMSHSSPVRVEVRVEGSEGGRVVGACVRVVVEHGQPRASNIRDTLAPHSEESMLARCPIHRGKTTGRSGQVRVVVVVVEVGGGARGSGGRGCVQRRTLGSSQHSSRVPWP